MTHHDIFRVRYEGSRMPHSFNVRAECATGYKGTALVTQCEKTEQPYSLNGCSPESCIEPSVFDQANYDIQIHSLLRPFFRVTAKCKHGFGTATVKECRKDGNPFELEGCMDACASPKKAVEAGYVVPLGQHFGGSRMLQGLRACALFCSVCS